MDSFDSASLHKFNDSTTIKRNQDKIISNNNMSYQNHQLQGQGQGKGKGQLQGHEGGFVKCIAIREFFGDPNLNQLCFKLGSPLDVDLSRPSENGWRLGRVGRVEGWIPEWAATPVSQLQRNNGPPPPPQCPAPTPPTTSRSRSRNDLRRSRDFIVPLQSISEAERNYGEAGFDQRKNDIMGGNIPRAKTADGSSSSSSSSSNTIPALDNHNNPFEDIPDANTNTSNNSNKWNSGIKKLFQKVGADNNESSSSSYNNPYTQKQTEIENDWTDAPQIVSVDGRIAVVETDGQTTKYKNENTYQYSTKTNQIADQFSTTASNFSHQISNFKMPPMPKMGHNNNSNSNSKNDNNNNNNEQQSPSPQQQQNQVTEVSATTNTNNENQQPNKKKNKKFGMPSSLKMPKMNIPKMNMPNSNKEQNQLTTTYCDMNGNEQILVEETKRSSRTTLDIYY